MVTDFGLIWFALNFDRLSGCKGRFEHWLWVDRRSAVGVRRVEFSLLLPTEVEAKLGLAA